MIDDDFSGGVSPELWVPSYLPHWTTRERAEARYRFVADGIELRIDADQLDWRPEDAPMRVSNLQTGSFSGPVGSRRGTHRHRDDGLIVRTETPQRLLFAPSRGRVEITLSASRGQNCMTAAWLVGTEHLSPDARMPLETPETADAMKHAVSTAMTAMRMPLPSSPMPETISMPCPICRAPRPSEAAVPNSVTMIEKMSIVRPRAPPVRPSPSNGAKIDEITGVRP